MILRTLFCICISYLIGTLNPSYLIAKLRGFDIREQGSGNAGASNAVITMGKAVGLFSAIFDLAKAYFAVRITSRICPSMIYPPILAGIAVILGHIFPITLGFRGGKGLACLGGVVLSFNVKVFLLMLLSELVLVLIVDYICVIPITASMAFPVVYYMMTAQLLGAILYAMLIPVFLYKHWENLKRIQMGMEMHFSYLWRKEEEIARLQERWNEINA